MGFVEDSIRKVWVGTNVSAIVGASTSVHKLVHVQVTSVSQVELFRVVIRLASTATEPVAGPSPRRMEKEN